MHTIKTSDTGIQEFKRFGLNNPHRFTTVALGSVGPRSIGILMTECKGRIDFRILQEEEWFQ